MGVVAPFVPYIMAAASAGMQYKSQASQQNSQDNLAAQGIMRQGQLNSQANQKVSDLTAKLAGDNPQAAIDTQKASYMKALQSVAPVQAAPGLPGASKKYQAAAGTANSNVNDYGATQADIMARTDAPTLQRIGEQEQIGRTAGDLGLLQNTATGQDAVTQMGIKSVAPNPWLAAASSVASGASNAYAKKRGWDSAAPPSANGGIMAG
jgi:hypothetical protein